MAIVRTVTFACTDYSALALEFEPEPVLAPGPGPGPALGHEQRGHEQLVPEQLVRLELFVYLYSLPVVAVACQVLEFCLTQTAPMLEVPSGS